MVVEGRCAHPRVVGELFDPEWFPEVTLDPLDGAGDLLALTARRGDLTQPDDSACRREAASNRQKASCMERKHDI